MSKPTDRSSTNSTSQRRKINWRKWRSLSIILVSGAFMIVSHQNCAPAPQGAMMSSSEIQTDEPSEVSVINEVKSGAVVSFSQKAIEISSTAESAVLEGVCPAGQEDAVLGWNLSDVEAQADFASGFAKCSGEKFLVELTPTQELTCGREYKLSARLGLSQGADVVVSRRCAPSEIADNDVSALKAHLEIDASAIVVFGSSPN